MADSRDDGWYVISLRPRGGHGPLRRAAARRGLRLLALSPWRIEQHDDAATRADLAHALQADVLVFTSPAAVEAAVRLQGLDPQPGQSWLAVGAGTARLLKRHGVSAVLHPQRMDSEGLLGLPELQNLQGRSVGFVSAPDGRNVIAPTLQARGARLLHAQVYARVDTPLSPARMEKLRPILARASLLLSSGGALERVLAQLPEDLRQALMQVPVIAASERLATAAHATGFPEVVVAQGPQPTQMLDAAVTRQRSSIR